ncbi:hypothetical protein [Microbacterium sp. PRC9]|uniref:hypothetical protein n=1 Tax=Microbacterium sp. PRC9 TaxID=2962591 RepID=UPI00288150C3|nr:hypothetical protein [Microbacterium sp. PRC9]MDT0142784.1 hypothetical protein [Microbacterium sp. PRC9]
MSNTWPCTQKQRSYGLSLENQLGLDESEWHKMTVSEASSRISMLVALKEYGFNPEAALDGLIQET